MKNLYGLMLFFSILTIAEAQEDAMQLNVLKNQSLVKNISFESIGPTVMSGRVVDVDVNPENPTEFYVAYASGGVWHTTNNGSSFKPILDHLCKTNLI